MGREGESATRWAFRHIYKRTPTPDELAAYERALHLERVREFPDHWLDDADRADLAATDPGEAKGIFARLASPSGAAGQPKASAPPVPAAKTGALPAEHAANSQSRRRSTKRRESAVSPTPKPHVQPKPRMPMRARALLREQLAGGPKLAATVEAAAQAAEIPKRELIAAADALGVRAQRGQWWLPG